METEDAYPVPDGDREDALDAGDTDGNGSRDVADVAEPDELPPLERPDDAAPAMTGTSPVEDAAAQPKVRPVATRPRKNKPVREPSLSASRSDEAAPEIPALEIAAGAKSVLDEMAELDADVTELRRQLAQKLTLQNAQLRKMLARFDAR